MIYPIVSRRLTTVSRERRTALQFVALANEKELESAQQHTVIRQPPIELTRLHPFIVEVLNRSDLVRIDKGVCPPRTYAYGSPPATIGGGPNEAKRVPRRAKLG